MPTRLTVTLPPDLADRVRIAHRALRPHWPVDEFVRTVLAHALADVDGLATADDDELPAADPLNEAHPQRALTPEDEVPLIPRPAELTPADVADRRALEAVRARARLRATSLDPEAEGEPELGPAEAASVHEGIHSQHLDDVAAEVARRRK